MSDTINAVEIATELTVAWLSNPNTRAGGDDVPAFLSQMYRAVEELAAPAPQPAEQLGDAEHVPAVSVRKSLASRDHIISMIDGKPYRTLRRHLSANGLTPEQYRERYKLRADYPMIAEGYSEARRAMAKQIDLGRKPRDAEPAAEQAQEAAPEQDAGSEPQAPAAAPAPKRRRKAAAAH